MEACASPSINTVLRPDWLYSLVRDCQLIAPVFGSTWGAARVAAVENFIRRAPQPESPLEQFVLRAVIGEIRWRAALLPAPTSERQIHVSDPRLGRALKIIESRRTDISLSQRGIAAAVGLSRGHLGRLFRAHIGCGVRTYVTHLRIREATSLLVGTCKSVKEVSAEVGFASEAQCDRCFKRMLGVSPLYFRRNDGARVLLPEDDSLRERQLRRPVDGVGLTTHITLPGV
jgi:transcriptional regulator GlxA family with amidase domain